MVTRVTTPGNYSAVLANLLAAQRNRAAGESLADREKKWNTFQSDPEWLAARAETEKDGPIVAKIVNQFLQPTAFSSVK